MEEDLREESEKLRQSWMRHEADLLKDYLVSGVEDPRINLQSILSRHFLVRSIVRNRFEALRQEEYRFSAVMNWCLRNSDEFLDASQRRALLHALEKRADDAEGLSLPYFVSAAFQGLPLDADGAHVPNYIQMLLQSPTTGTQGIQNSPVLNIFRDLWRAAMLSVHPGDKRPTVLEPACGSANDFRFISAYGLAGFLDYTGLDLCEKNVRNARLQFPSTRFSVANVFAIPGTSEQFDFCFVHDLFEHLSLHGLRQAVAEVCRCTKRAICAGFFNMEETAEHQVVPYEDYHWNTLSLSRTRELFREHHFEGQVLHAGEFLKAAVGCDEIHNPNAYTFMLYRDGNREPFTL